MVTDLIPGARIPASVYRLQFNNEFRFMDAKKIVPYLHELGITDIYASPYFKAREGSIHGYDIVDPNILNPEIGSEGEHNELADVLNRYEMGQILDIVPNHMCIASKENIWWMDVLENGPGSVYACFFDIDWDPVKEELKNKVLLPILGAQYGKVLENQELRLSFEQGAFYVNYYTYKLPIMPQTYAQVLQYRLEALEKSLPGENPNLTELLSAITALSHLPPHTECDFEKIKERQREKEIIKKRLWSLYSESQEVRDFIDGNVAVFNGDRENPRSFDLLDRLLSEQAYRLSHWRVATEEINYRRFFDVNELATIRMQDPVVFKKTHELIFKLIREGKVTGLRVDHPDGLYNPSEYFRCLQRGSFIEMRRGCLRGTSLNNELPDIEAEISKQYDEIQTSETNFKPFYIVGEKILTRSERMPDDWPIFSTTGYAFLNSVNGIFVNADNQKAFNEIYSRFIRSKPEYHEIVCEKKRLIMKVSMSSEIYTLAHYLNRISEKDRHTRDFTLNSLIAAIVEVIAFFPVYRTYITSSDVNDRDRKYIELSIAKAKRENPAISESIFEFLKDILLLNFYEYCGDDDKKEWLDFVMRFQQITGPVMAKGVEDTAFYIYNRLVSLNEVGGSPDRFGTSLETFHGQNIERSKFWPHALIATSTHDTKRNEDVRARINVLSELPEIWKESLARWSRLNKKKKPVVDNLAVPDRNEEYLFYQTLVGVWPLEPMDKSEQDRFIKRVKDYMLKAVREAKVNTSWINPHAAYEGALISFIEKVMDFSEGNLFLADLMSFQKKVSLYGMFNSLSQTLLKITSPGVPDFYQGTEIWNYSLVDPDNRRPVDYETRFRMLEGLRRQESEMPLTELARELLINKEDGRIKLYLIYRTLNYRRSNRELFERGEYLPLEIFGDKSDSVCVFARKLGGAVATVVAPRFFARFIPQPESLPLGRESWGDSAVIIPFAEEGEAYRNIFTGETVTAVKHNEAIALPLSEVLANFPVALLERSKAS